MVLKSSTPIVLAAVRPSPLSFRYGFRRLVRVWNLGGDKHLGLVDWFLRAPPCFAWTACQFVPSGRPRSAPRGRGIRPFAAPPCWNVSRQRPDVWDGRFPSRPPQRLSTSVPCVDSPVLVRMSKLLLASNVGKFAQIADHVCASMEELSKTIPPTKIYLLQISDAYKPAKPIERKEVDGLRPRGRWSHDFRPMPYDGGYLPIEEVAKAVLKTGFRGYFSMEIFDGGPEGKGKDYEMDKFAKKRQWSICRSCSRTSRTNKESAEKPRLWAYIIKSFICSVFVLLESLGSEGIAGLGNG